MLWRSWRSREDDAPSTTSQQQHATTDDVSVAGRKGRAVIDSASSPTSSSSSPTSSSSSSSSPPTTEVIKRPPFLGIGATLFFVAFTGAALYGFRAAKKADLREAQEAAASAARVGTHAPAPARAQQVPSALSGSTKAKAPGPPPSAARGLDWGSAGKSAPSVLSRSGGGGASTSSSSSRYAVPLPKMSADGRPIFDEPPALTAIKAFGAATALVAVTSVVIVEVGRRVLGIQDVYDLTDRLHAFIPKTFALPEAVGNYLRPRLAGLFPQSDEDRRDPLAPDSVDDPSAQRASASSSSSSSWLASLFSQHHQSQSQSSPTAPAARDVEDVFTEIEHAPTMKQKLELLDAQLRGEKALEDAQRVELRLQREGRKAV